MLWLWCGWPQQIFRSAFVCLDPDCIYGTWPEFPQATHPLRSNDDQGLPVGLVALRSIIATMVTSKVSEESQVVQ